MNKRIFQSLTALSLLITSSLSYAEGILIKSEPKNNAALTNFDGNIKLWFSGNVSGRSPSLVVVDNKGNRVDNSDSRLVLGERHRLTATTKPLTPGAYAVRYRVITEDGLIVSGVSKFSVTDRPVSTEVNP
ncbi:copper resistance CopC family protein [Methylomonas fluvii]|uniref:Copper resistance protein C n=1 Tax=Methylomonas fluvii TaxID=1854564 RepID=A0ABR9DH91_9GAMM|nr:copper resistance protein CopC [Methylomonas fluvii]MBD9361614.1 copper resistance protein CopC [Methylomonas fluvii]CAD6874594.1 Copper resistance protein CopC [Methylomonas fluvii]